MYDTKFVILHFVYHDINMAGCPAKAVYDHLRGFFKNPKALLYKEIIFNLPDDQEKYFQRDEMKRLANQLMDIPNVPVWLFFTAHGDRDRGDVIFHAEGAQTIKKASV